MTCPECGYEVRGGLLGCPACLQKRGRRDALAMAGRHAPDIVKGALLTVRRATKGLGTRHVALPNYHDAGFCQLDLTPLKNAEKMHLWEIRSVKELCPQCLEQLESLVGQRTVA